MDSPNRPTDRANEDDPLRDDDVPRVDPRDGFSPPAEPCECYCLHCGRTFGSEGIWLQRFVNPSSESMKGYWMCPTPNCGGMGFTFDIFPTDSAHPCNAGWCDMDEIDDEELLAENGLSIDEDPVADSEDKTAENDPAEHDNAGVEEQMIAMEDETGEEWKRGLSPGDYPLDFMGGQGGHPFDDPDYDEPDHRPREVDEDVIRPDFTEPGHKDGDIPF